MNMLTGLRNSVQRLLYGPIASTDPREISSRGAPPSFTRIFILNVKFSANASKFEIELDKAQKRVGVYDIPQGADLQDALTDIYSANPSSKLQWKKLGSRKKNNGKKVRNPSDMSFNPSTDCFIIYQVLGNSDLRYSVDSFALSESKKNASGVFSHPNRIAADGQLVPDEKDTNGKFPLNTRAAILAYNHAEAQNAINSDGDFEGRLNLHLDVVDDHDFDGRRSYIPIVVDPDVRFPGGNGGP